MDADILFRTLLAFAIIVTGLAVYGFANRLVLARAAGKFKTLQGFTPGIPAILYFTTPTCAPCKTVQRPAIQKVKQALGEKVQVIEIDASERKDLADDWGVLSVPTTFIIDKKGQPRQVNHG
ncbi:MAG: thioredoxin family protein, partial [Anaerolineales bacterium]